MRLANREPRLNHICRRVDDANYPPAVVISHPMRRFHWRNIPIPEPFVAALLLGGLVQIFFPLSIPISPTVRIALGITLILTSLATVSWAVCQAGDIDLEVPSSLLTSGPYAFSRNPMYLAWAIATFGIALAVNSAWLITSAILATATLNFITIPAEEHSLKQKFTHEYEGYQKRVRRWL